MDKQLLETFGSIEALTTLVVHLCNGMHQEGFSALSRVFDVMRGNVLQLAFSEGGLVMFQDYGCFVYPYRFVAQSSLYAAQHC